MNYITWVASENSSLTCCSMDTVSSRVQYFAFVGKMAYLGPGLSHILVLGWMTSGSGAVWYLGPGPRRIRVRDQIALDVGSHCITNSWIDEFTKCCVVEKHCYMQWAIWRPLTPWVKNWNRGNWIEEIEKSIHGKPTKPSCMLTVAKYLTTFSLKHLSSWESICIWGQIRRYQTIWIIGAKFWRHRSVCINHWVQILTSLDHVHQLLGPNTDVIRYA